MNYINFLLIVLFCIIFKTGFKKTGIVFFIQELYYFLNENCIIFKIGIVLYFKSGVVLLLKQKFYFLTEIALFFKAKFLLLLKQE